MKTYIFKLEVQGEGKDENEAWSDAINSLMDDPGVPPDSHIVEDTDIDLPLPPTHWECYDGTDGDKIMTGMASDFYKEVCKNPGSMDHVKMAARAFIKAYKEWADTEESWETGAADSEPQNNVYFYMEKVLKDLGFEEEDIEDIWDKYYE